MHRARVTDVIEAVKSTHAWTARKDDAGQHNLTAYAVQGSLLPLDDAERHYSVDLGQEVVNEFKIELHCEDTDVAELVEAIRSAGVTGQSRSGWIYVVDIVAAAAIH